MRALLIFNPIAGRASEARLESVRGLWCAAGWSVEQAATNPEMGARAAARQGIAAGCELLVACGGDGTLSEIAGELAAAGGPPRAAVAVLPFGTANVFARDLGLPLDPVAAAQTLLAGRLRPVPLGLVRFSSGEQRHFVCFASCGFDAQVIHCVSRAAKRRYGVAAFVGEALRQIPRYGFPALTVSDDGARRGGVPASLALCTLTRHYAGPFALYPPRMAGAPYLLLCHGRAPRLALQLALFLAGAIRHAPGVSLEPLRRARIAGAAPVQLDGEAAGFAPLEVEILPAALTVLAP